MRRVLPAIALFFVAPLVAEFLLGDLPVTMLGSLIVLAPAYGGGALLIREVVRRAGRGWASILVLALAYAILEEAFLTQTLFNPDYLGLNLHLLQPAYIPALGIGAWWTVFVLTLHTVWSISVSIGLVEALVPDRATMPWLGRTGLTVVAILFILAAAAMARFSIHQDRNHFVASVPQFGISGVVFLLVLAAGLRLPRPSGTRDPQAAPRPWIVGTTALIFSSAFLLVPNRLGWWAVAIYLVLDLTMIVIVGRWSRHQTWGATHRLALAAGAALSYAWHAFLQNPVVGGSKEIAFISHVVFAGCLLVLLAIAARRVSNIEDANPGNVVIQS